MWRFVLFIVLLQFYFTSNGQEIHSIGIHINPILGITSYHTSGSLQSNMKILDIGLEAGIEFNYKLNDHFTIAPVFNYFRNSQKIINQDFLNYLRNDSYTWQKYSYENFATGLLVKYKVMKKSKHDNNITFGLFYTVIRNNLMKGGYHIRGNEQTEKLESLQYVYSPYNFISTCTMLKPVIGYRTSFNIKKIGRFEYGFLFYFNTKKMPDYTYQQTLVTSDKGTLYSDSHITSNQSSIEVAVIYKLINLDRKFKRIKLRKIKSNERL